MAATTFDAPEYFEKLKAAGMPYTCYITWMIRLIDGRTLQWGLLPDRI